ncbi:MAG: TerB family tellurite resistance protein [bacterium]
MSLRQLLSALGLTGGESSHVADSFLGRLQAALARLGAERLEYLAGFAGQLARVANVEGGISAEEAAAMAAQLSAAGKLEATDAMVVVDLLRHEFDGLRAVQTHELSRAINAQATADEKLALVDCLYAVAAADRLVSDVEEQEIRRIADSLLVPHRVQMEIRGRYRDRLEVLQSLPRH